MRVPLFYTRASHNLGKALGEGLGLLCAPFTLSIPFTSLSLHISIPFTSLSLSPLYPFHLSIPFTSLSFSPLYPFHLSIPFTPLSFSPSLSYLSLPLYISPSTFLSLSLLSIILFGVSNGRFRPCCIKREIGQLKKYT